MLSNCSLSLSFLFFLLFFLFFYRNSMRCIHHRLSLRFFYSLAFSPFFPWIFRFRYNDDRFFFSFNFPPVDFFVQTDKYHINNRSVISYFLRTITILLPNNKCALTFRTRKRLSRLSRKCYMYVYIIKKQITKNIENNKIDLREVNSCHFAWSGF